MNVIARRTRIMFCAGAMAAASGACLAQTDANTFVAERQPDQWLASSLKARNVYDRGDAKIGVINDLVIGRDGRVSAVVIGVGGFLGIGEKNVGVPFQDLKITLRDSSEWLVLDRSKDDLRAAPAFGVASGRAPNSGADDRNFGTLNAPGDGKPP